MVGEDGGEEENVGGKHRRQRVGVRGEEQKDRAEMTLGDAPVERRINMRVCLFKLGVGGGK